MDRERDHASGRRRSHSNRNAAYRGGLVWGLAFIAMGVVFLLDRLHYMDIWTLWSWWPVAGAVWGLSRIVAWSSADDVGQGVTWTLIALWVLANQFEWLGLEWSNSWPLVLVAVGTGMVTTSALRPVFGRAEMSPGKEENGHA